MTDYSPEHEHPTAPDAEPDAAPSAPTRVDRRSFLRALSGSALTLVAGGLTVTLTGCNGAPGGNPIVSNSSFNFGGLPGFSNSTSSSSSSFPSIGGGGGGSASGGSSGSGSSSSGSGSSNSGSGGSGSSSSGGSDTSSSGTGFSSTGFSSTFVIGTPSGAAVGAGRRGNTRH